MNAQDYNKAKNALKVEICDYFTQQGVNRATLKKIGAAIKIDVENGTYTVLSKMAPRHHAITTRVIDELIKIETQRSETLYQESISDPEYQARLGADERLAQDMGWNHGI